MKINWKRVLIAGLWAEALLMVIRIPIIRYIPLNIWVGVILWFVPMFLGGLWVARKIESHFILHGALVGVVANIVFIPMGILLDLIVPTTSAPAAQSDSTGNLSVGMVLIASIFVKIIGSALGSYVVGKSRRHLNNQAAL